MSDSKPTDSGDQSSTRGEEGKGERNTKRASAAALIDAFAQQYQADRAETGRREKHRIFREWLTIIGLFIAAVVAFFQWRELRSTDHNIAEQARISAGQLATMENQLKEMRSTGTQTDALIAENKKSADAATLSAKAAQESAKISSDTARRQLRAYIDVTGVKVDCPNCIKGKGGLSPPKKGVPEFRLVMNVKNFGTTPAYQVRACHGTYMTELYSFPPDDFTYDCGDFCKTCPPMTIGPGAEVPIVLPLPVSDVVGSSFGFKRMFDFGKITFNDTFSASRKHSFCWFFQGNSDAFGCPKNNADQEDD